MEIKQIVESIKQAKTDSPKRNFKQKIDFVINLKDLDLKKNENHVDFFAQLHHSVGKKIKVCALGGLELSEEGKKVCDNFVLQEEFKSFDKVKAKKLANGYDFFIAQANLMGQIAGAFGKVFGPRGKMPNPKAGCVVPPKAALGPLYEKLQTTVRISAKKDPVIHLLVGNEDMKEEEVADNIKTIYEQLIHHLPGEINNIKSGFVKLTMGKPVKLF
ncbi:50S ribosomal protein L1 [archaeon D22]|nr:50S ribosomal protein L1 [archaeon D22]